jgi:hypothetical protein
MIEVSQIIPQPTVQALEPHETASLLLVLQTEAVQYRLALLPPSTTMVTPENLLISLM